MEQQTMQIAMLCVHSSPLARLGGKEAGGMNVYVRELSRELGRRGLHVDIFTRWHEATFPMIIPMSDNVRLIHIRAGPQTPYNKNHILQHADEFLEGIEQFAAQHHLRYNLIHSHYWVSGALALRLRAEWRCPIVQMFHTLGRMKNRVARSAEETETLTRIAIEEQLLREVDAVIAATTADAAQMLEHCGAVPQNIHIIPCGVDVTQFCPKPRHHARAHLGYTDDDRLVISVGRMEPLKGMDCLIRAGALLCTQGHEWQQLRIVLIGGEPDHRPDAWNSEQRRLDSLRHEVRIAAHVRFAGACAHADLATWYNAADAVVVASHYESFGMVALEAMACGAVVIASNIGGLSTLIEHGRSGLFIPVDDHSALAEALAWGITNESMRRTLMTGARRRAWEYRWEQIAAMVCRVYDSARNQYNTNIIHRSTCTG